MKYPLLGSATLAVMAVLGCTQDNPNFNPPAQPMDAHVLDGARELGSPLDLGAESPSPDLAGEAVPPDAALAADAGPALDLAAEAPGVAADRAVDDASDPVPDAGHAGPDGSLPVSSLAVGLVARYRLDSSSGTGVPDDSGSRNGSKSGGATWTPMGFPSVKFGNGGALSLDGTTGYVTLPTAGLPAVGGEKSLSLWFFQTPATSNFRRTLITVANPDAPLGIHIGLQRGIASVWTWGQSSGVPPLAQATAGPGGWTHLAYTYRAGTHVFYVGGAEVSRASTSYGGTTPTTLLLLGAWSTSETNERWSGLIDDLRIFARVLTASEVRALADGSP